MADVLSIGLIGAGRIGMSHAQIVAERVPTARLAAVADPRPEAAEALAGRFGARSFTDPTDLINDPEVDAVLIAASSDAHADLIVAAATAGNAVFCEKPMSMTLADADRALAAVEQARVVLQVGMNLGEKMFEQVDAAMDVANRISPIALRSGRSSIASIGEVEHQDPGLAAPRPARTSRYACTTNASLNRS